MRALLVVNPRATSTSAAGRDVLAYALASNLKLDVVETEYRGHAADAAAQAAIDGVDLVVAHGGDGTVNEVVNGMLGAAARTATPMIGVVPGGSANVFARALGLPIDPVEATHQLLQAIRSGRNRPVGLGIADGRWFTFNAGIGWDADVVARVDRRRGKQATPALYMRMALLSYFRLEHRHPRLTVELPGEPPATGMHMAFVSNTDPWTYLGPRPLHMNPGSSFDHGLGLVATRSVALPTVVGLLTQVLRAKKKAKPGGRNILRRDDVDWIRVRGERPMRLQVDGDYLGERSEVEFRSVPGALRVVV